VLADVGVQHVNAQADELIATGVLRRLPAFTELKFSNSMIEDWWRSLKHQCLFLHPLHSVATIRRLVAFYVYEHNQVPPHSAFRGQTLYFGTAVPADLNVTRGRRGRARVEANRSASGETCRHSTRLHDPAAAIANSCASRQSPREPDRARPMSPGRLQNPITVRLSGLPN
jgi:hypothetical protein